MERKTWFLYEMIYLISPSTPLAERKDGDLP